MQQGERKNRGHTACSHSCCMLSLLHSLHTLSRDAPVLPVLSSHPCPSPQPTSHLFTQSSCKLGGGNGEEGVLTRSQWELGGPEREPAADGVHRQGGSGIWGAPKRSQQELGYPWSLQGCVILILTISPVRGTLLICSFQPWLMLPDKQGPCSCQVSLSQSLCK